MTAYGFLTKRVLPWSWAVSAVAASAVYLLAARLLGSTGFALDDAWIHQTYARNLATTGVLAFVPGQPSAGSTSPLWTLLITLGYLLRVDYKWWTYALGTLCLAATALGVWRLSLRLFPDHPRAAFWAGISCALEWHLAWAAVSGMETALFTALSVWLLIATALQQLDLRPPTSNLRTRISDLQPPTFVTCPRKGAGVRHSTFDIRHSTFVGMLCGLIVLTRPEGLLLVGIVLLAQIGQRGWMHRATWANLAWMLTAMAILVAPWLVFNWHVGGTLFPNTFYAKQREYAVLLTAPVFQRLTQVFSAPFVGMQVLLVPGLIAAAWSLASRLRRGQAPWIQLVPLAWAVAHLALYALRLPVTYQHGRYEMPVIPVLIAFGIRGAAALLGRAWHDVRPVPRVLSRAAVLAIAVTQLGFVAIGARAYATDVAIIEGEMVKVARWLDANTVPNDLIAAHDIGAIGYFSQRPLVDLAGLISPEVIPFIRDEARLWALVRQRGAAYLVTFPSWYPRMTSEPRLIPAFAGNASASPEHLTVYRIP